MAIHLAGGDYCCTNLLDGDDRLYRVVPAPRCGVRRKEILPDEIIGLAEPETTTRAVIAYRPAREQIARLRAGEVKDPTIWVVPAGRLEAACWY